MSIAWARERAAYFLSSNWWLGNPQQAYEKGHRPSKKGNREKRECHFPGKSVSLPLPLLNLHTKVTKSVNVRRVNGDVSIHWTVFSTDWLLSLLHWVVVNLLFFRTIYEVNWLAKIPAAVKRKVFQDWHSELLGELKWFCSNLEKDLIVAQSFGDFCMLFFFCLFL